jgi:DHA1 family multidrug resistance protein-like MFS transporter
MHDRSFLFQKMSYKISVMGAGRQNLFSIYFSQYGNNFSFNFVGVFLPFYITGISPYPLQYTLVWVGIIMGSSGLSAAITSTFWGSLAHRFSPKMLYLRAIMVNVITFFLMGFTTNLYLLLTLSVIQGLAGGVSTIGMILVSSSSEKENIPANIGVFQSVMTLGQLTGPPLGSLAAGTFGYRGAFFAGAGVIFASFVYCYLYVKDVPCLPRKERSSGWAVLEKRIIVGWALVFTAVVHISFLPSILPNVLDSLKIERTVALKLAGTVVMFYTASAMIGTYVWSRLSRRLGLHRLIPYLLVLGVISPISLALSQGIVDFTVLRMIQTGIVAAIIPLVISMFVSESRGGVIGFLNSARFTGSAVGPMIATSILAISSLPILYLSLSFLGLLALLGFKLFFGREQETTPSHFLS